MQAAKQGHTALVVCSTAFVTLGRSQLNALGGADLPIAVMPHPFGVRTRAEVRALAETLVDEVARLATGGSDQTAIAKSGGSDKVDTRAETITVLDDLNAFNDECEQRGWSDGLPLVPPTVARVDATLAATRRDRNEIVAHIAPGFGAATVERIAINAVMAGCR
ncbi:MAG TPA: hypothetical protein VEW70_07690, partial [Burkholderiales bacterium]|nr:hypothetical protein [Burkholderiales bacterium]